MIKPFPALIDSMNLACYVLKDRLFSMASCRCLTGQAASHFPAKGMGGAEDKWDLLKNMVEGGETIRSRTGSKRQRAGDGFNSHNCQILPVGSLLCRRRVMTIFAILRIRLQPIIIVSACVKGHHDLTA
jgi:hypothetical protein